jgi:hypothetical protein
MLELEGNTAVSHQEVPDLQGSGSAKPMSDCPPRNTSPVSHAVDSAQPLVAKKQVWAWSQLNSKWNCAEIVRDNGFGSVTIRFCGDSKDVKVFRAWTVPFSAGMPTHAPKGR